MNHGWNITSENGFLLHPDPPVSLETVDSGLSGDDAEQLDMLANALPALIRDRSIRSLLDDLPQIDVGVLKTYEDGRIRERVFQIYSYFATAYLLSGDASDSKVIPASVAVPLVNLSEMVKRPPILAYATYTLGNWQRVDPTGAIEVENLRLLQKFIDDDDAAWFTLTHVEIEAEAAPAIMAITDARKAIAENDMDALERLLIQIQASLREMMTTFRRMQEGCDPDVYYQRVRPYMFGFDNVIYEDVEKFKGQPQSFRGETGAQSSVIPALIQAMGLEHEETEMTRHLAIMRDYMPAPHRDFLASIDKRLIRDAVRTSSHTVLRDVYNTTLRQILEFRRLHLRFASTYIAEKVENPSGTGGTLFMAWLQQLIDETERQFL